MTKIFKVDYLRRVRLIYKSKLNRQNKIEVITTLMVAFLRYGALLTG